MFLLAQLNALERKFQRAAPGSYPGLAAVAFGIGFYPFLLLTASFEDLSAPSDIRMNIQRILLALATLFCWYVGRLSPIMTFRKMRAPFQTGAPAWTTIVSIISLPVLLSTLAGDYLRPHFLSPAGLKLVRLLAFMPSIIAGGVAQKAQGELEAMHSGEAVQESSRMTGKRDLSAQVEDSAEISIVDRALADMHKPEFQKSGGILTIQDLRLSILGWVAFECLYAYFFYICYELLQKTIRQSEATEDVSKSTIYTMGACVCVAGLGLIFIPIWAIRCYHKWKGRQTATVHEDSISVESEVVEKQ